MWLKFRRRFNFAPPEGRGRIVLTFPAGYRGLVRIVAGRAALAAGAGELLDAYEIEVERRRRRA